MASFPVSESLDHLVSGADGPLQLLANLSSFVRKEPCKATSVNTVSPVIVKTVSPVHVAPFSFPGTCWAPRSALPGPQWSAVWQRLRRTSAEKVCQGRLVMCSHLAGLKESHSVKTTGVGWEPHVTQQFSMCQFCLPHSGLQGSPGDGKDDRIKSTCFHHIAGISWQTMKYHPGQQESVKTPVRHTNQKMLFSSRCSS